MKAENSRYRKDRRTTAREVRLSFLKWKDSSHPKSDLGTSNTCISIGKRITAHIWYLRTSLTKRLGLKGVGTNFPPAKHVM